MDVFKDRMLGSSQDITRVVFEGILVLFTLVSILWQVPTCNNYAHAYYA